jgi:uncharacterized protein
MSNAFVWFHNGSEKPAETVAFYEKLLGWKAAGGPPGTTMFAGESGPFAGVGTVEGKAATWIPYVQMDDVDAATKRAVKLGAGVVKERTRGPAGDYAIVRDPGGASVALWQKA